MTKLQFTLLTLCLGFVPAHGSVIFYSSLANWQAASSNITTIGFEGIAPAGDFANENSSLTLSGVNFTVSGTGAQLFVMSSTYSSGQYSFGSGDTLNAHGGTPLTNLTITLPSGIRAIGFDYFDSVDGGFSLFESSAGIAGSGPFGGQSPHFWGITSTSDISTVLLQTQASFGAIDNVRFGQAATAAATPEPGSLLLVGCVLLGAPLARRRFCRITN